MRTHEKFRSSGPRTHEGGKAVRYPPLIQLERLAFTSLLWEDTFYEDGVSVVDRTVDLINQIINSSQNEKEKVINIRKIADLAVRAREEMNIRHFPLLLLAALAPHSSGRFQLSRWVGRVIKRPDDATELLALEMKLRFPNDPPEHKSFTRQIRKGIALALQKFDAYQLSKYMNRKGTFSLRDVFRIARPKPKDKGQEDIWGRLVRGELQPPETWEVLLSKGGDDDEHKKEVFEKLLIEDRLGYLALVRNLRLMHDLKVDADLIHVRLLEAKGAHKLFPYQILAAAFEAPVFASDLDEVLKKIKPKEVLPGLTVLLVDASASMEGKVSQRSEMAFFHRALALAAIAPVERKRVFLFSEKTIEVPALDGMGLVYGATQAAYEEDLFWGTNLTEAVDEVYKKVPELDRLILITDEQSQSFKLPPKKAPHSYVVNVTSYSKGVAHGAWELINGFSPAVFRYMLELEKHKKGAE